MKKDLNLRPSGFWKRNKPKVMSEVLTEYFSLSNEPLAVALRKRQATKASAEKGGVL